MREIVLATESLGKKYRLRHHTRPRYVALRDVLTEGLRSFVSGRAGVRSTSTEEDFWAVRDLSLAVGRGEAVGVIGRNGAGKSTLLKMLSRIVPPTTGRIRLRGRVGSLLEVGTGFHPELSGRENIFLNGTLLGMRRQEIRRRFDEIVAFAEIERFLDTPVKRYSSGMYVRLAFAVAAHLEPEILIVDEVLAVGDLEFQRKCLGKMEQVSSQHGRTVLFVSHNLVALRSLCSRAIWLDGGRCRMDGPADEVTAAYMASSTDRALERRWSSEEADAPRNERLRLIAIALCEPGTHVHPKLLTVSTPFDVVFRYEVLESGPELHLAAHVWNTDGVLVFSTFPDPSRVLNARSAGVWQSRFTVPAHLLNNGTYRIQLYVVEQRTQVLSIHDELLVFEVHDHRSDGSGWHGRWPGAVRPELPWHTAVVEDGPPRT